MVCLSLSLNCWLFLEESGRLSFHSWGGAVTVQSFLPFVENGSVSGPLESQSLRNGFSALQSDIFHWLCFISVFVEFKPLNAALIIFMTYSLWLSLQFRCTGKPIHLFLGHKHWALVLGVACWSSILYCILYWFSKDHKIPREVELGNFGNIPS